MCDLEFGSGTAEETGTRCRGFWYERLVQPCLVELLGSGLFIFIGCLSVIENGPETGLLQPALAHGLALGLIVASLGNIRWDQCTKLSGANLGSWLGAQDSGGAVGWGVGWGRTAWAQVLA